MNLTAVNFKMERKKMMSLSSFTTFQVLLSKASHLGEYSFEDWSLLRASSKLGADDKTVLHKAT